MGGMRSWKESQVRQLEDDGEICKGERGSGGWERERGVDFCTDS